MEKIISKKATTLFGGLAVILLTALSACSDDEIINESSNSSTDQTEHYVEPERQPTADAMTVKIMGKTYVFEGNYSGEGQVLVSRVAARAASLQEEGVQNIIIPGSHISSLSNKETADMLLQMCHGAALVVTEPTADNMKMLAKTLHGVIDNYSIGGNNEEVRNDVNQILGSKILDRILSWTDNHMDFIFGSRQGQEEPLALLAIREEESYAVTCEPQDETKTLPVVIRDENGNVTEETTVNYVDDSVMKDYHYGIKVDNLAKWLDTPEDDPIAKENSRRVAAKMMANHTGGQAEDFLEKITESVDHTFSAGFQLSGPEDYNPYHDCEVKYRIWTAYSGEKKCDVYCVTEEITAYNQKLGCGPSKETNWWNGNNWSPLDALNKKVHFMSADVYGPYMKEVSSSNELLDNNLPVTLEQYAPQNSTSGGSNVTDGFSFTLGASVSAKSGGPEAGISSSMQWSHSVSKFDADLTMKVKAEPEGKVTWSYTGKDPDSHYRPFSNYHEKAKSILTTTCTLQQAWVWTVKGSTSSSVYFRSYVTLQDHWLTYAIGRLECIPHYIKQGNAGYAFFSIPCPPRYLQTWSMNVESKDVSADKMDKIESFLATKLSQYFMPNCVFSTMKPEHKRATSIADCDEVGKYVEKCKKAYEGNAVRELLHEAGLRAGLTDADSYTIVWRHTDVGVNSDREEYTFHMNAQ